MPRTPSKHGLERKFKSWRKGKSKTSQSKGSLKHQLRGVQRLLAKLPENESERRKELQEKAQQLQQEIDERKVIEMQRKRAKDSHGIRFLERQRLTRAERSTRRLWESSTCTPDEKERYEKELRRIALDQVYVAHFPHDIKYMPLFSNGVRKVDVVRKNLVRRATTRSRILKNLKTETKVAWISEDQYRRLPSEWSVELEESTFAAPITGDTAETEINDNRFAATSQHAALLEAAEQAESIARKEVESQPEAVDEDNEGTSNDDSSGSSTSSSSDEEDEPEADPMAPVVGKDKRDSSTLSQNDSSSSSPSDTSSDSGSSSEDETQLTKERAFVNGEHEEDTSSDSDSDDSTAENETESMGKDSTRRKLEDDFDDFLMPATEEVNVFENARQDAPDYDYGKPDKSKGWASQRQRPGQFKKRRVRY